MLNHKVQKSGNCYSVYLPKEWVIDNKLEKGSPISMTNDKNSITITTNNDKPSNKLTLNINNNKTLILNKLIKSAFISGYDEFEFKTSPLSNETLSKINQLVKNLGLNLIKINKNGFVIKADSSVDDLLLFCWEYIYKIINITRMILTGEKNEIIKDQIISTNYNKITIQRTVYRYQQLLSMQRMKNYEANLCLIIAVNLNKIIKKLINVKDKKYIKDFLTYMEKFIKAYNYPEMNALIDIINETDKLKNQENRTREKTEIYELMNEIINAQAEFQLASNNN